MSDYGDLRPQNVRVKGASVVRTGPDEALRSSWGTAARYRALEAHINELHRQALATPPGEQRDAICREALAVCARMLELKRGAA